MISGDRNSKFFHTRALQCFHRNRIVELRNSNGVRVSSEGTYLSWFEITIKICSYPQGRQKWMKLFYP